MCDRKRKSINRPPNAHIIIIYVRFLVFSFDIRRVGIHFVIIVSKCCMCVCVCVNNCACSLMISIDIALYLIEYCSQLVSVYVISLLLMLHPLLYAISYHNDTPDTK